VIVAPARSAIERTRSVPAALSFVATTAQLGSVFHAGRPFGSEKANSAIGRWVAPAIAACSTVRSAHVVNLCRIDGELHRGFVPNSRRVAPWHQRGVQEAVL